MDEFEQYRVNKPVDEFAQFQVKSKNPAPMDFANMPKPEGFFAKLPRNVLAGLGQFQRNIFNIPHDLAESAMQETGQFTQGLPEPKGVPSLQQYKPNITVTNDLPYQPEFDYAKFFGQKGAPTLMDMLIQKGTEHIPELAALGGIMRSGLRKYPMTKGLGSKRLKEVEESIIKSGLSPTKISPGVLHEASTYLPKTRATDEMLHMAYQGDYPNVFGLQSQIGRHRRNLAKSPLASERLQAPQVQELLDLIRDEMHIGLKEHGLHKESETLKEGLDDYRKYMKFKQTTLPAIKKAAKWIGYPTGIASVLGGGKLINKLLSD